MHLAVIYLGHSAPILVNTHEGLAMTSYEAATSIWFVPTWQPPTPEPDA